MNNYIINKQGITLPGSNGSPIRLSLTENSGRIVYRDKINTLIGIKHPGIELGIDHFGNRWFVHHHYKNVKPTIEMEDKFALGETIFFDNREVNYNRHEVLERALLAWWFGNTYHWLWQNCQHFVNEVSKGVSQSETIERVSDNSMIGGGIATLIGILARNKALTNIGIAVTLGGVVGKGLSKLK